MNRRVRVVMTRQYGEGTRALRGHRAIVPFGWYGRLQLRRGGSPCADQEYFDPSDPVYEDARQDEVRFDIPSSAAGSGCQRRRRCTFRILCCAAGISRCEIYVSLCLCLSLYLSLSLCLCLSTIATVAVCSPIVSSRSDG